jgi:hypothetical protein
MTRKRAKLTALEWFSGISTPEMSRTLPFGFRLPEQNAIVDAVSWSSGNVGLYGPEHLREQP